MSWLIPSRVRANVAVHQLNAYRKTSQLQKAVRKTQLDWPDGIARGTGESEQVGRSTRPVIFHSLPILDMNVDVSSSESFSCGSVCTHRTWSKLFYDQILLTFAKTKHSNLSDDDIPFRMRKRRHGRYFADQNSRLVLFYSITVPPVEECCWSNIFETTCQIDCWTLAPWGPCRNYPRKATRRSSTRCASADSHLYTRKVRQARRREVSALLLCSSSALS